MNLWWLAENIVPHPYLRACRTYDEKQTRPREAGRKPCVGKNFLMGMPNLVNERGGGEGPITDLQRNTSTFLLRLGLTRRCIENFNSNPIVFVAACLSTTCTFLSESWRIGDGQLHFFSDPCQKPTDMGSTFGAPTLRFHRPPELVSQNLNPARAG